MRHLNEGTLRRLVDEPAAVSDAERGHVSTCDTCLAGLTAAREDAAHAALLLAVPNDAARANGAATARPAASSSSVGVDAAWARLRSQLDPGLSSTVQTAPRPTPARRGPVLLRPAAAVVGAVLLVGGASAAAAADWLPILHTSRVAPVTVTEADLSALPDLSSYGDIRVVSQPHLRDVVDLASAEQQTALSLPRLTDLPRGVTGEPQVEAGDKAVLEFTFDAHKVGTPGSGAVAGAAIPVPPPGLDGATFRLEAGPGAALVWSDGRGVPALVVGRAHAPRAYSSGVSFQTARDYLLSLPGVPAQLAQQLKAFDGTATASTFPFPVPAGAGTTGATTVDGHPATSFTSRDGALAGLVWVDGGIINAVVGSLSVDELRPVAAQLG